MNDKLQTFVESVSQDWTDSHKSSSSVSARSPRIMPGNMVHHFPQHSGRSEGRDKQKNDIIIPNSVSKRTRPQIPNGSVNQAISNRLREISSTTRGTDHKNTCPLEYNCSKGGVDLDGKLVVFIRNSAYKYVNSTVTIV